MDRPTLKAWAFGMGLLISALAIALSMALFDTPNYYMALFIVLIVLGVTINTVIPMIIWMGIY